MGSIPWRGGIDGVDRPDWAAWEKDGVVYLESLGNPRLRLFLVSVSDGGVLAEVASDYHPHSNIYAWTKWADDSATVIYGEDARWFTSRATLYRIENGFPVEAGDLAASLSEAAAGVLREAGHPVVRDTDEVLGFIEIPSLSGDGTAAIDYRIESKFEGDRTNAHVAMTVGLDFRDATVASVRQADLPGYVPQPADWAEFSDLVAGSAPDWLNDPPTLPEPVQFFTAYETGVVHLFNRFGAKLGPGAIESVVGRPLFLSGPHQGETIDNQSRFSFGHYDPIAIAIINDEVLLLTQDSAFLGATQSLYNFWFRETAHHFQDALRYWTEHPTELERQKAAYLDKIRNETLPDFYYLLENDLAQDLMDSYSSDYEVQASYLTALRFWMRRSCDGSFPEFASLLQVVLRSYDRAYFSEKGLPELIIDPMDGEEEETLTEAVMEETGPLGIDETTPLSLAALQERLPGFEVVAATRSEEGEHYPAFLVRRGAAEVLEVTDYGTGDPSLFRATSRSMKMPNGLGTGDTFAQIFARQYPIGLWNGLETDAGGIIVPAPGSERIRFRFVPPDWSTYRFRNSQTPTREELADFILEEMWWYPNR